MVHAARCPFCSVLRAEYYDSFGMRKAHLARRLAKESGITTAAAADHLDHMVSEILRRVRSGQSAALPGFGTFRPGRPPRFQFDLGLTSKSKKAPR